MKRNSIFFRRGLDSFAVMVLLITKITQSAEDRHFSTRSGSLADAHVELREVRRLYSEPVPAVNKIKLLEKAMAMAMHGGTLHGASSAGRSERSAGTAFTTGLWLPVAGRPEIPDHRNVTSVIRLYIRTIDLEFKVFKVPTAASALRGPLLCSCRAL